MSQPNSNPKSANVNPPPAAIPEWRRKIISGERKHFHGLPELIKNKTDKRFRAKAVKMKFIFYGNVLAKQTTE